MMSVLEWIYGVIGYVIIVGGYRLTNYRLTRSMSSSIISAGHIYTNCFHLSVIF
jgi:hypothetical protein